MTLKTKITWCIFCLLVGFLLGCVFSTSYQSSLVELLLKFFKEFSSSIIALCALLFTIYQAHKLYEEKQISNLPEIIKFYGFHNSNTDLNNNHTISNFTGPHLYTKHIALKNAGLGPARIKNLIIKYNNEILSVNSKEDYFEKIFTHINAQSFHIKHWHIDFWEQNQIIAPKEDLALIKLEIIYNNKQEINDLNNFLDNIFIELEYTSLMNEGLLLTL